MYFVPQRLEPWREKVSNELSIHAVRCGLRGPANDDAVRYVAARLGLMEFLQHDWRQLSGAYQLKLELAKALLSPAEFLILDEPLAPLDINAQVSFLEDLRNIACEQHSRRTVVLSTQHIWEVEQIADRILYLEDGCIHDELLESTACIEIYGQFSEDFISRLQRIGQIYWTHFKRRSCLIESTTVGAQKLLRTIFDMALVPGTSIESVRDISRSRLRDLRKRPSA